MQRHVEIENVNLGTDDEYVKGTYYAGRYGHCGIHGSIATDNLADVLDKLIGHAVAHPSKTYDVGEVIGYSMQRVEVESICDDNYSVYDVQLHLRLSVAAVASTQLTTFPPVTQLTIFPEGRCYTIPEMGVQIVEPIGNVTVTALFALPDDFMQRVLPHDEPLPTHYTCVILPAPYACLVDDADAWATLWQEYINFSGSDMRATYYYEFSKNVNRLRAVGV